MALNEVPLFELIKDFEALGARNFGAVQKVRVNVVHVPRLVQLPAQARETAAQGQHQTNKAGCVSGGENNAKKNGGERKKNKTHAQ